MGSGTVLQHHFQTNVRVAQFRALTIAVRATGLPRWLRRETYQRTPATVRPEDIAELKLVLRNVKSSTSTSPRNNGQHPCEHLNCHRQQSVFVLNNAHVTQLQIKRKERSIALMRLFAFLWFENVPGSSFA